MKRQRHMPNVLTTKRFFWESIALLESSNSFAVENALEGQMRST